MGKERVGNVSCSPRGPAMPSHTHVVPRLLNTHVVDTWSTVTCFSPLKVRFRRATLCRQVITIQMMEAVITHSCLHIRPMSGGFASARSTETASDIELNWSEPAEWTTLPEVLSAFAAQKSALTASGAAGSADHYPARTGP